MKQDISYTYSKNLFDRLSKITIDGVSIHTYFEHEGFDYWQFYKQRIFEDIKVFSRAKSEVEIVKTPLGVQLKDFVVNSILLMSSLVTFFSIVLQRKQILVYAIDRVHKPFESDFRLNALYRFLNENNLVYSELFHTVLGQQALSNLYTRKRLAMYLEAGDWLHHVLTSCGLVKSFNRNSIRSIDLTSFEVAEQGFVKALIMKYARQVYVSHFKIRLMSRLFRLSRLKVLFAIDDARYYYEILHAARCAGVATYALQHGHFTKYHVGWLRTEEQVGTVVFPAKLLVWSSYWKNELVRLGSAIPEDLIQVGGEKSAMGGEEIQRSSVKIITVLIPYETSCPKTEVAHYINRMLACPNVRVVFKLRQDIERMTQLTEYGLETVNHERFIVVTEIADIIGGVDIVAGVYSTFLYEMIAYGKQVVILETSSDYGEGLHINELADVLRSGDNIGDALIRIQQVSNDIIQKRKQKLLGDRLLLQDTLIDIARQNKLL